MIVTRSALNQFLSLEGISSDTICRTLSKIGLEVEQFREIVAPRKVVVGKILECQKHPNATKLNVCQVAVGGSEDSYVMRQIVCGAPNARAGIYVAVALEGAKLPDVTIKKAVLRGVESCGMLCSTTELGFPSVNNGIVELDASVGVLEIGQELCLYPLFNEEVYEISITPNRGDCMSLLGIARDLSVAFDLEQKPIHSLKDSENAPGIGRVLQIVATQKHHSSLKFKAIESAPCALPLSVNLFLAYNESLSGVWIKDALQFSTFVSGVILNAYPQSFCQLEGEKVVLTLKEDEQGLESIYRANKKLSTIGANLCGCDDVDIKEKEFIILEASYIPPEIIAQKVMETKVKVEPKVFQRSSRGSNPDLDTGLSVLVDLLLKNNGVLYADHQELVELPKKEPITIDIALMMRVIGVSLEKLQVVNTLKALGFIIEIPADENLIIVKPPLYRHDIVGFQDVVEEVVRFYGIDNIASAPLNFVQHNQRESDSYFVYSLKRTLAKKAVSVGFNETVHFVFEDKEKLREYGFETLKEDLELVNPITQDFNTLRSTLLLGLLKSAERNCKNGFNTISLFEIGEVYSAERVQMSKMAFLQSGLVLEERYPNPKGIAGEFFGFCERVSRVIGEFSLELFPNPVALFHSKQCAKVLQNGEEIGWIATLHPKIAEEFGLSSTYLCELSLKTLESKTPRVKPHSKYPKTQRDLSVVIAKEIPYLRVKNYLQTLKIPYVIGFYPLDVYCDATLGDKMSLTLRFELQSEVKTLEEKDISEAVDFVLEKLKKEFAVELR